MQRTGGAKTAEGSKRNKVVSILTEDSGRGLNLTLSKKSSQGNTAVSSMMLMSERMKK